jgi:O-antigen/teichoic acid export membrane protein
LIEDSSDTIKFKAKKAAKWAFLGDILSKIITPLFLVILARFLTPTDYGLIGIATLVTGLAQMIQNMGLDQALIQTDSDISKAADVVFWSNLSLSFVMYFLLFLIAPYLAVGIFHEPLAIWVIRIMGLQLIISAFDDVQEALLRRDFQFKQLLGRRIIPSLAPAFISIPLAILGYRYWSLVIGSLVGTTLGVIFLWKVSQWRPSFHFDIATSKALLGFGTLVTIESFQGWALNYGDNLAAGYYLGVAELGNYTFAFTLSVIMLGYLIAPLTNIVYPAFSRLKNDKFELQQSFTEIIRSIALIVFPINFGLTILAGPIITIVFGNKWEGAIVATQILAIMPGLSYLWIINPTLYRAIGRPDVMPKFHIFTLLYIIPVYILGGHFGLTGFSIARASVGFVFLIPHIWLSVKLLNLPWQYFWDCIRSPFIAGLLMCVPVLLLSKILSPFQSDLYNAGKLVLIILSGAVSYFGVIWIIDSKLIIRMSNLGKQLILKV